MQAEILLKILISFLKISWKCQSNIKHNTMWAVQTSANKLTPPCYSKNIQYSAIIRGRIVGRIVAQYSTPPWVKYLYFRYSTPYSTRNSTGYSTQVTRPRSIKLTIWLQLDLGHWHLVFASMTNLESGPRFAKIIFLLQNTVGAWNLNAWIRRGIWIWQKKKPPQMF